MADYNEIVATVTPMGFLAGLATIVGLWWKITVLRKGHDQSIEERIKKEEDIKKRLEEVEKHGSGGAVKAVGEIERKYKDLDHQVNAMDTRLTSEINRVEFQTNERLKNLSETIKDIRNVVGCLPDIKTDIGIIKDRMERDDGKKGE